MAKALTMAEALRIMYTLKNTEVADANTINNVLKMVNYDKSFEKFPQARASKAVLDLFKDEITAFYAKPEDFEDEAKCFAWLGKPWSARAGSLNEKYIHDFNCIGIDGEDKKYKYAYAKIGIIGRLVRMALFEPDEKGDRLGHLHPIYLLFEAMRSCDGIDNDFYRKISIIVRRIFPSHTHLKNLQKKFGIGFKVENANTVNSNIITFGPSAKAHYERYDAAKKLAAEKARQTAEKKAARAAKAAASGAGSGKASGSVFVEAARENSNEDICDYESNLLPIQVGTVFNIANIIKNIQTLEVIIKKTNKSFLIKSEKELNSYDLGTLLLLYQHDTRMLNEICSSKREEEAAAEDAAAAEEKEKAATTLAAAASAKAASAAAAATELNHTLALMRDEISTKGGVKVKFKKDCLELTLGKTIRNILLTEVIGAKHSQYVYNDIKDEITHSAAAGGAGMGRDAIKYININNKIFKIDHCLSAARVASARVASARVASAGAASAGAASAGAAPATRKKGKSASRKKRKSASAASASRKKDKRASALVEEDDNSSSGDDAAAGGNNNSNGGSGGAAAGGNNNSNGGSGGAAAGGTPTLNEEKKRDTGGGGGGYNSNSRHLISGGRRRTRRHKRKN
jgi:hypothetical protein